MENKPIEWKPPDNFQLIDSDLDGIVVYAPIKQNDANQSARNYLCPSCGAVTRYDIAAGGVACEHCGYTAPSPAKRIGGRADEHEFTLESLRKSAKGWGINRREIRCENCGAVLSIDDKTLSTTCSFCGSNKVNLREVVDDALRPSALIPFKIEPKTAYGCIMNWLGKGWYHPSELSSLANLDRLQGIYLPFWIFAANIRADWKAEVGYERQERYYDSGSKEWKTRIRIDWRWETGNVGLSINHLTISASSHIRQDILERLYPFNYGELVVYNPDFLAGWNAQQYDIVLSDAWEKAKARMREQAKQTCRQDIPSPHVRNLSLTADFADETWKYVLLPIYLVSYQFNQKVYQVMVNGQSGLIAGQKPVAWWKIWLAIAGMLIPGLVIGLIGLILLVFGGIGMIPLVIGGILLVIGLIISISLYQQAYRSEA